MTETGSGVVYDGVPLDGVEVRIAAGEVHVRCPMLFRCYRDGTSPLVDGWFATGDGGRLDADGKLVVDGRIGELIITGGENVWPQAVEAVLSDHPAVRDVAVAGRPDAEWGETVVAYVVPDGESTLARRAPRPRQGIAPRLQRSACARADRRGSTHDARQDRPHKVGRAGILRHPWDPVGE